MSRDLSELTAGERLLVWRRRNGYSQRQAAERFGVDQRVWSALERDRRTPKPDVMRSIGRRETNGSDLVVIARRRSGMRTRDLAISLGVSHVWLIRMEHDGAPRLVAFWRERGFRFPE